MQPATRQWFSAAILTLALVLLIDLAVGGDHDAFFMLFLGGVLGAVCFFYLLFPRSWFFTIALADFLAVYACIFVFLTETNFQGVSAWSVQLGFVLPIVFFLAGVWWQRRAIKDIVTGQPRRARPRFSHTFVWLFPILVIGGATFVVPGLALAAPTLDGVFLAAMAAVALLSMLVSRSVCTVLLDTGLLFEEFFQQISRLLYPGLRVLHLLLADRHRLRLPVPDHRRPGDHLRRAPPAVRLLRDPALCPGSGEPGERAMSRRSCRRSHLQPVPGDGMHGGTASAPKGPRCSTAC